MALPAVIVTGASGFIGRHLLEELRRDFRIFAIARRSQRECGAPIDSNIAWMQVDVADVEGLSGTFREIASAGGATFLIHLAGYYDFTGLDHLEYRRTNVQGTRNILDLAKGMRLDRFVFVSSVAACAFPRKEGALTEATPPDGEHVYAWSKREGERLIREYATTMPVCIVRLGAVYSDWCEYPPLYVFLGTWLGGSWKSRILAGRGEAAVPYVHIRDVVAFFRLLLVQEPRLDPAEVLIVSTSGSTSQRRLFDLSTRHHFGAVRGPLLMPPAICGLGLLAMNASGHLTGTAPFERPWMRRYIDRKLEVDNSRTLARTGWAPSPRYHVERRLPFLIERLESEPFQWHTRNVTLMKRETARPALRIYKALATIEDPVVETVTESIRAGKEGDRYPSFLAMGRDELHWCIRLLFRLLLTSVQSSNRMLILDYLEVTGFSRFAAGSTAGEICRFLDLLNETILSALAGQDEVAGLQQQLYDSVTRPLEFGKDEVVEQYERFLRGGAPGEEHGPETAPSRTRTAREMIEETIWSCLVQRK